MQPKPLRLLLIGPLPPPIGGVTVLFEYLVEGLSKRDDVELAVINISEVRGKMLKWLRPFVRAVCQMIRKIRCVDVVSLHAATPVLAVVGPAVLAMARIWHKPLLVRKFAGTDYRNFNILRRTLVRLVLRGADLYLAETKMLVQAGKEDGIKHVEWYPNNRPVNQRDTAVVPERKRCRRFVYLGHVRPFKGIEQLIEAAERFELGISVDVYGPFLDGFSKEIFKDCKRVRYRGIVKPKNVVPTLAQYDAMLLPTYATTEGYPGAILEAYLAGIPVIASRCGAIPEIVDESCGVLIEPHSSDELYEAMKTLVENERLWAGLRQGTLAKQESFSTRRWTEKLVEHCRGLVNRQ